MHPLFLGAHHKASFIKYTRDAALSEGDQSPSGAHPSFGSHLHTLHRPSSGNGEYAGNATLHTGQL